MIEKVVALRRGGKELFFVGLGQAAAAIGSLVGVRILTGVLNPLLYGELSLAMTFFTLSQQLVSGPLSGGFSRFYVLANEQDREKEFFDSAAGLTIGFSLIIPAFGITAMLGMALLGHINLIPLTIWIVLFTVTAGTNLFLDSIQTAARHRSVVAWHQGIAQWLRFGVAAGLVLVLTASSSIAMAGYFFSALLVLASQLFFFKRSVLKNIAWSAIQPAFFNAEWTKKLVSYTLPLTTWGIFTWAQMTSDRWALQAFTSTRDVGFYAALYQLGFYPIVLLSTVVSQFISPILYRQAGDARDPQRWDRVRKTTSYLVLGSLAGTLLAVGAAFLFHNLIFHYLVAPEYRAVSIYLPWLVLSSGFFATGQFASMLMMSSTNPKQLVVPKVTTAVLGVGLNFLGAYLFGMPGVILAGFIFSLVYLIWVWVLNLRYTGTNQSSWAQSGQ